MPDIDYAAWLSDPSQVRSILIEAEAYRPGTGVVAHYASNRGYISHPTDSPPNMPYPNYVTTVPEVSVIPNSALGWDAVKFANPGGVLDDWLTESFGARPVRLYIGAPEWAKEDYLCAVLTAAKGGLIADGDGLQLPLADGLAALDNPIQTATVPIIPGDESASGDLLPLAFGTCFNIAPVFLKADGQGAHYQVNHGQIAGIVIRSGGLPVNPSRITVNFVGGTFRIDPPPTAEVTCDVVTGGGAVLSIAATLFDRAGVAYDFSDWPTRCKQAAGLYLTDKTTYREALGYLFDSVGLSYHAWYDGTLRLFRAANPIGNPVKVLVPADILEGGVKVAKTIRPLASIRLGYARNYSIQSKGSLLEAVDVTYAEQCSREWSTVTGTTPDIATIYPDAAVTPDSITETALALRIDAQLEVDRRLEAYVAPIMELEVTCFIAPLLYPGDAIFIQYPRFGLDEGRICQVQGLRWCPTSQLTVLILWVWPNE